MIEGDNEWSEHSTNRRNVFCARRRYGAARIAGSNLMLVLIDGLCDDMPSPNCDPPSFVFKSEEDILLGFIYNVDSIIAWAREARYLGIYVMAATRL